MNVKDAGVWKPVNALFIKDSGTWKTVVSGWIKDAGVWKQFFTSVPPVSLGVFDNSGAPVVFHTDGTSISAGNPNWYTPTTGGIGNSKWLRLTQTGGNAGFNTSTGIWIPMSSNISVTPSPSTAGKNVLGTFEIANDASGASIYGTGSISVDY